MKQLLTIPCVLALALAGASTAQAQSMRIGTVDMSKVFQSYAKTKEAESRINESRAQAKKELEERMDTHKKSMDAIKKLDEDIKKPELSKEARDAKEKDREQKVSDFRQLDREILEFQRTREKQLQEQALRMRAGIVDEIMKIVTEQVKAENYEAVFDKSGPSGNGIPFMLHAKSEWDFTDKIIAALNKQRPSSPAPAAAPEKEKETKKK
jgi:outer membrane protein